MMSGGVRRGCAGWARAPLARPRDQWSRRAAAECGWLAGTAGRSGEGITQGVGVRHVPAPPRHRIKQLDQHSHLIMLALKKKREAEAKAKAEAEAAAAASPGGKDGASAQAPEKVSILGIGGKKKKDSGKDGAGGKKRTPGEIRIQKGEAAFDGTKCTLHARIFVYESVFFAAPFIFYVVGWWDAAPHASPADGATCYVSCSEPGTPGGNF